MNPYALQSFGAEMQKVALPSGMLQRAGRFVTNGAIPGAAVGAGAGAVAGAAGAGEGSRLQGALGGAVLGGLTGAAGGAVGRRTRDNKLLNPAKSWGNAAATTVGDMGRGVKNFGKRQIHGLTGAYQNELGDIGWRSSGDAAKKVNVTKLRLADDLKHAPSREARTALAEKARGRIGHLVEEGAAGDDTIRSGITSLPGIAKGLATNPVETGKAMWKATTNGGKAGAALAVGAPIAFSGIHKGDESATGGRTVGQKLLHTGAEIGAGIATGGTSMLPGMLAYSAGGKLVDALTGKPRAAAQQGGTA